MSVGGVARFVCGFFSELVVSPPTSVGGVDSFVCGFFSQFVVSPPTSVGRSN